MCNFNVKIQSVNRKSYCIVIHVVLLKSHEIGVLCGCYQPKLISEQINYAYPKHDMINQFI